MADVKKINGYNIKDETARNDINKLNSDKQDKLKWVSFNQNHVTNEVGTTVIYPYQATEHCAILFNYKVYGGLGFTELQVAKYDINGNWLSSHQMELSSEKSLLGISGTIGLALGEQVGLVCKGGEVGGTNAIFGDMVVLKL